MTEYLGHEHFLRVHHDDEVRGIEVFHPDSCGRAFIQYEFVEEYTCDIAHHIREWGYDLHLKDVPDGTYAAQYWATPPGWAGPMAVDADGGIELNRLIIDEAWWRS